MREKDLYRTIDRPLPQSIHRQSMTGSSMTMTGTVDRYYDGDRSDLWVEYKMLKSMPRSGVVIGDYTQRQLHWMERRYNNSLPHGRTNVVGIVGLPNRKAVVQTTPTEWREGSPVSAAIDLKEVSAWICDFCLLSPVSSTLSVRRTTRSNPPA
jgi:hypothetical protein